MPYGFRAEWHLHTHKQIGAGAGFLNAALVHLLAEARDSRSLGNRSSLASSSRV